MTAQFGKQEWIGLFRNIGLTDAQMEQWHRHFETDYPDAHQSFLEWLKLDKGEVDAIRQRFQS